MGFSKGNPSITLNDILNKVSEAEILSFYLGVNKIPCVINSPLREDRHPSFSLYSKDGNKIYYKDFSSGDRGGTFELLSKLWNLSFKEVLLKINREVFNSNISVYKSNPSSINIEHLNKSKILDLKCTIRDWEEYDIEYWESYGVTLKWLKYAEVYPISHIFIIKENNTFVFKADKYAYTYVERKEGKITLKIYQPFNKNGYKWSNKHDHSVISLWTKIPEFGEKLCICSSLKDALCLWNNTGIPSIAVQGEGYNISNTALNVLKNRFKNIYILFDSDEAGIKNSTKLSERTGFKLLLLPKTEKGKDISDIYHFYGKIYLQDLIKNLINT